MFFAGTAAERRRARLAQDRVQAAVERRAVPRIYRVLNGFSNAAAEAVLSHADSAAAFPVLDDMPEALMAVLAPIYREAANRARIGVERDAPKNRRKPYKKDAAGEIDRLIQMWIAEAAAWKVQKITSTTRLLIQRAIEVADQQNLTLPQRAKLIQQRSGGLISRSRARTIARTEAHAASMSSSLIVAEQVVPDAKKVWVASLDARTRDTHDDADGQVRDTREPFNINGVPLMYPGDQGPNAPAETINCRCVMVYN